MINQYPITDIHEWIQNGTLLGDPPLDSYDKLNSIKKNTLLRAIIRRQLIPPVYIGTRSNARTRNVVRTAYKDGSTLSTINQFVSNELILDHNAGPGLAYLKFRDLPDEIKSAFLTYQVPVFEVAGADRERMQELIRKVDLLNSLSD